MEKRRAPEDRRQGTDSERAIASRRTSRDVGSAPEQPQDAGVQVISGASVQSLPLAGLEVSRARELAGTIVSIEARAPVLVNGERVSGDYRLSAGDILEFVHHAGEKGGGLDLRIEIVGDRVLHRQNGREVMSASLEDFLGRVVEHRERTTLREAIPEGVRFVTHREDSTVLVMEEKPQVRTVRWLADDSPAPFGPKATYRTVRLAFPFIVIIAAFQRGALTGYQQCFYRTSPLQRVADPLFLPNLYNVAEGYGQKCWLCLVNLKKSLAKLSWDEKVREIRNQLWSAGFNQSSEVNEGMSYWQAMRRIDLDPRLRSLDEWEEESGRNPLFPLTVDWKPLGKTVGEVMEETLSAVAPARSLTSAQELVHVFNLCRKVRSAKQ